MIDPVSLVVGIAVGAIVGIGGSIWFVKRKLRKMQDNMFGGMGGMMQDPQHNRTSRTWKPSWEI